jgi:hypothetical protein
MIDFYILIVFFFSFSAHVRTKENGPEDKAWVYQKDLFRIALFKWRRLSRLSIRRSLKREGEHPDGP